MNTYGNIRPATFIASDCEILFQFQKNISTQPEVLVRLTDAQVAQIIQKTDNPNNINEMLGGVYNLNLNASFFNRGLGYYRFFIDNKKLNGGSITIRDCGILEETSIKGIIVDLNDLDVEAQTLFGAENALAGYKIEYFNTNTTNGEKLIPNVFRIITGNYRVEPISTSLNNNQSALGLRYKLNKNSTLVFLTVTPDGVSDIDITYNVFIGTPLQNVRISNTFFEPVLLEFELIDVDLKTLSYGLFGDQVFNYEKGLRTYFDDDGNIFKQFTEITEKNDFDEEIKKVKTENDEIDFTEEL